MPVKTGNNDRTVNNEHNRWSSCRTKGAIGATGTCECKHVCCHCCNCTVEMENALKLIITTAAVSSLIMLVLSFIKIVNPCVLEIIRNRTSLRARDCHECD